MMNNSNQKTFPPLRSILIYLVLSIIFVLFAIFIVQRYWNNTLVDFPSYYYGAKVTFVEKMSPYTRNHWNTAIMLFGEDQDLYPYVYLPPSLLFFYPLLYFDYHTIQSIFTIGNIICLPIIFWLFHYQILKLPKDSLLPILGAIYLVISPPVKILVRAGQIDLFILLLICIVWWAVKYEKHEIFIIFPLAIAIIMKLYPMIILFYLFIQKKFKIVAWVLLIVIVLSLISAAVLPENTWINWYDFVGSKGYGEIISLRLNPAGFGNQNINGFFSRLFLGRGKVMDSPTEIWFGWTEEQRISMNHWAIYSTVVIVALTTLIPIGLYSLTSKQNVDLIFALILLLMMLIAPLSNINHLVYSIPAYFAIIYLILKENRSKITLALAVLAAIILVSPFNLSNPDFQEGYKTFFLSTYFYSIVLIWAVAVSLIFSKLKVSMQEKKVGSMIQEWFSVKKLSE